jgi:hypothetical protein
VAWCVRRFADDGPCTLSQSGASEEGAISKAKRMMAEAATAQASIFMRGEGTDQRWVSRMAPHQWIDWSPVLMCVFCRSSDNPSPVHGSQPCLLLVLPWSALCQSPVFKGSVKRRDVDGTCCLLDTLAAPKVSKNRQQDILSTLVFLTSGSEINAGSVVASRGMATLVPLLGKRCEATVAGAVQVISNLLISPAGQVGKPGCSRKGKDVKGTCHCTWSPKSIPACGAGLS